MSHVYINFTIHILMSKKFYWLKIIKDIKEYVKDYDMCQRIKKLQYCFYDEFSLFFILMQSWVKILINYITKLFSKYYDDDVYNAILIIIDCFLKITRYIFTKLTWSIENLINVLFDKILLVFFSK